MSVTTSRRLTDQDIIFAISVLTARRGYPPTVRELMAEVGLKSPSSMQYRLVRLDAAGKIIYEPGHMRTMRVVV